MTQLAAEVIAMQEEITRLKKGHWLTDFVSNRKLHVSAGSYCTFDRELELT